MTLVALLVLQGPAGAAAGLGDCRDLDVSGKWEPARRCYLELADTAQDVLVAAEALTEAAEYRRANEALRVAAQAEPKNPEVRVRWGRLYLMVHQNADAERQFQQALQLQQGHRGARLGLAQLYLGQFEGAAGGLINELLNEDPGDPEAQLLSAQLQLEQGESTTARGLLTPLAERGGRADQPLIKLRALALLAAADRLEGKDERGTVRRALRINPHYGAVYAVSADYEVTRRRYRQAVGLYEKAIDIQPRLASARADLGVNLLRVGDIDAARKQLEQAYEQDPFSAQIVNTLRLLDTWQEFESVTTAHGVLRLHKNEAGVLKAPASELLDNAVKVFGERYGYVPKQPVLIELYPHHEDFAVRTVGMPGIGILGATFGNLLAMDSPSARGANDGFDWASALWHELAHVVTLGATDNWVPRWFSEGVSVFEERRTGPTPSRAVPLNVVAAYREGMFLPIVDLDQGFIRPSYEDQILVSYMQSGLVCEHIADTYGQAKLAAMLKTFDGKTGVADAIQRGLGVTPEVLQQGFDEFLQQRLGGVADQLDRYRHLVSSGHNAARQSLWPLARSNAEQALQIYGDDVSADAPRVLLARAQRAEGDEPAAFDTLKQYWRQGGRALPVLDELIELSDASADPATALAVQRDRVLMQPLDALQQRRFGERLLEAGDAERSVQAFLAALSLSPHDQAAANYRVANAYHRAGKKDDARRYLLTALEGAPRYKPALDLLLEINR